MARDRGSLRSAGDASAAIVVEVQGIEEVMRRLGEVERKFARKVLSTAVRATLKSIIVPAIRAKVPVGETGALRRAIKIKAAKRSRKLSHGVWLSARIGKEGQYKGDTFYGAFQEFGWHVGRRGVGAANKRGTYERPWREGAHFMRDAFEENKQAAQNDLEQRLREGVDKVVSELGKS